MDFIDISHDEKSTYVLSQNEKYVFFLFNRQGEIVFELAGEGAEAHIFACFIGKNKATKTLHITQRHIAARTVSATLVKSVLSGASEFAYDGTIRIETGAARSDASQECRALLLSPDARATAKPTLEILADDVRCRHAAAVSPLNTEQLFFTESRGLSQDAATQLLVTGFFGDLFERLERLGIDIEPLRETITANLPVHASRPLPYV